LHPFLINIGPFHLPTYGTMLSLAVLSGIFIAMSLGRRVGLDSGQILDYSTWTILIALVGAKVLMVVALWSYYAAHPEQIFSIATLKMAGAFYGGFLAALFFTVWYVRVHKLPFWKFTDVLVPSVALGTGVTRLGCFGAGCDYGKPTTVPWGVVFTSAFAHANTGVPLGVRLHPAQLYECIACLAIFGVLLWWFPRKKRDGDIFLGYLGLYAVARFFIEFLRGDEDRGFMFHHLLSTSQFIALLVLAGIAGVLLWRRARGGEQLRTVPALSGAGRAAQAGAAGLPRRGRGTREWRPARRDRKAWRAGLSAPGAKAQV
jgi:phosphatidylglycerol:prolipoprotein diacylglycerol transferase